MHTVNSRTLTPGCALRGWGDSHLLACTRGGPGHTGAGPDGAQAHHTARGGYTLHDCLLCSQDSSNGARTVGGWHSLQTLSLVARDVEYEQKTRTANGARQPRGWCLVPLRVCGTSAGVCGDQELGVGPRGGECSAATRTPQPSPFARERRRVRARAMSTKRASRGGWQACELACAGLRTGCRAFLARVLSAQAEPALAARAARTRQLKAAFQRVAPSGPSARVAARR